MIAVNSILALDLSIGITGWAVLNPGPSVSSCGIFKLPTRRTTKEARAAWHRRRYVAFQKLLADLLTIYSPSIVAYEFPDKPRSVWSGGTKGREFHAMAGLGLAEGFLIAAIPLDANLRAVSTSEAKWAATGLRDASKSRVRSDLAHLFGSLGEMTEDEVDAVAVGLAALNDPTGESWPERDRELKRTPRAVRLGVRRVARRRGRAA